MTATVLDAKIGKLENKIPVVNGLLKKTDHDTKISDIKNISYYFWWSQIHKRNTWCKNKIKKLLDQSGISNLVKSSILSTKFSTLEAKAELTAKQDEIVKLQAFDLNYVCGKSHFEDDGTHRYIF